MTSSLKKSLFACELILGFAEVVGVVVPQPHDAAQIGPIGAALSPPLFTNTNPRSSARTFDFQTTFDFQRGTTTSTSAPPPGSMNTTGTRNNPHPDLLGSVDVDAGPIPLCRGGAQLASWQGRASFGIAHPLTFALGVAQESPQVIPRRKVSPSLESSNE